MKKIRVLLRYLSAALLLLTAACTSEPNPRTKPRQAGNIPAVDSLIQREIDRNHLPGAVIRIQQGDSILHRKAYGYARKYECEIECEYGGKGEDGIKPLALQNPELMTPEHLFDLASLTKVCATTFGIMMLVDGGQVKLDDPVYRYLPEFNKGEKKQIAIRHLLTHTSGLYQWLPLYYHASDKKERYEYVASLPLKWPVGEARHYSDLGFMLLGDIIERVSGESLDEFLDKELYQPLNLQYTTFNPMQHGFTTIASTSHGNPFEKHMVYDDSFGYQVDEDPDSWNRWRTYTLKGEVNDGNAWYANGGVAGHAGLFSTVDDLQKLVTLLLKKGSYKKKQLISEAVIDTFLTQDAYGNGLGWAMDPSIFSAEGAPAGTFGHTGFTGTHMVVMPSSNLSIILLTNRQNVGVQKDGYYYDLGPLRQKIADVVLSFVNGPKPTS